MAETPLPHVEGHEVSGRVATVRMSKGDYLHPEAMTAIQEMLVAAGARGVIFLRDGTTFETMSASELHDLRRYLDSITAGE